MSERRDLASGTFGADDADEATIWAGRLRAWPAAPAAEPADEATRLAVPGPRRTPAPDADDDEPTGGSTMVARRESRRRANRSVDDSTVLRADPGHPDTTAADVPAAVGRTARVPSSAEPEIYRPRADAPARVARAAPPSRPSQDPRDHARTAAAATRGRRRGVVLALVAGGVVVVVGAATALLLITLPG